MGNFENDDASRARKLAKRRKTNIILNSLITVVLLLIVFVTVKIFFGDGQSEAEQGDPIVVDKQLAEEDTDVGSGSNDVEEVEEDEENTTEAELESESDNKDPEEESEPSVTEGGDSPDVKQTIVKPDWKPVGTTQTGEHQAVYDQSSVDWQEMLKAISYATGIDAGNMTVWYLGNNGGPQSAAGTVSEKGASTKYRVAIEWVEGEGWKPTKVEELLPE